MGDVLVHNQFKGKIEIVHKVSKRFGSLSNFFCEDQNKIWSRQKIINKS